MCASLTKTRRCICVGVDNEAQGSALNSDGRHFVSLLTRLKNDGLLSYRWEESTSGPPRKYYSLTTEGEDFLTQLQASWDEIAHTVNHLQKQIPQTPKIND